MACKKFTHRQLTRFVEISEIWEREQSHETPTCRIYKKHIEYQYGIGITTFYKILDTPAKRLLREMNEKQLRIIITDENFNIIENENTLENKN